MWQIFYANVLKEWKRSLENAGVGLELETPRATSSRSGRMCTSWPVGDVWLEVAGCYQVKLAPADAAPKTTLLFFACCIWFAWTGMTYIQTLTICLLNSSKTYKSVLQTRNGEHTTSKYNLGLTFATNTFLWRQMVSFSSCTFHIFTVAWWVVYKCRQTTKSPWKVLVTKTFTKGSALHISLWLISPSNCYQLLETIW